MRCTHFSAAVDTAAEVRVEVHADYDDQCSLFLGDEFGPTAHIILTAEAANAIIVALTSAFEPERAS